MEYQTALEPLVHATSRILVLGTMPGRRSIERQQYYAHPGNRFWKILFFIFGEPFESSYGARTALLERHGVALWNVLASCHRQGSSDSYITAERPNDFSAFHRQYPAITHVFFESKAAARFYQKHCRPIPGIVYAVLPSTSGLNAGLTLAAKIAQWQLLAGTAADITSLPKP